MLKVPDEDALHFTASKLEWSGVDVTRFHEPDLNGSLTAIAASGPIVERKLSKLPLMLKGGEDDGREHVVVAGEGGCAGESE